MNQTAILFPLFALAALTFIVLLLVPYRRFKAAFARKVTAHDFKVGESANVPPEVSIPNRNLINLLETPLLFYVICLMYYVTGHADSVTLCLAWSYVALRVVHSLIHLTYNGIYHRLIAFAASCLVLFAIWVKLFIMLIN